MKLTKLVLYDRIFDVVRKGDIMKNEINNRSPYVRDYDYNSSFGDNYIDRFTSISELEKYLEKVFIPKHILYKKVGHKKGSDERCLSIQLNAILKLKCSSNETTYIIKYLCDRNIHVGGFGSTLDGEFDNYDYFLKYRKMIYPESISYEEQMKLFEKLQIYKKTNDPRKKDVIKKLAEGCLRLIPYVGYRYSLLSGIDMNELSGYGCEGLIHAIDRYDPSLGYKFTTFAVPYIKNKIYNGMREIRGFNKDKDFYGVFMKCRAAVENGYSEEAGMDMTIYDDPRMIDDIITLMVDTCGLSSKREAVVRNKIYMLYAKPYDLCTDTIFEYDMEEEVIENERLNLLWKILDSMPERERDILFKRFGFEDGNIMLLEDIGKLHGISKERVRQLEKKALIRLQNEECLK